MATTAVTKVFMGSIPHAVSEEELRAEVSQYGTVTQLFYMQDQVQQNRGWAFVTYATREEAVHCINSVDSKLQFPGATRPVEARFANQKGGGSGSNAAAPTGASSAGLGYHAAMKPASAWQSYYTPEGHPYYHNALTGQTQWERPAELDAPVTQYGPMGGSSAGAGVASGGATSEKGGSGNSFGPPGSNLFVFHLPSDWGDFELVQHFQHYGAILSAKIQKDSSGRNRGFGFVSFDNVHSSISAIRGMNGFSVGGKFLKVQLKKGEEHFLPPDLAMQAAGGVPQSSPYGMPGPGHMPVQPIRYAPY